MDKNQTRQTKPTEGQPEASGERYMSDVSRRYTDKTAENNHIGGKNGNRRRYLL